MVRSSREIAISDMEGATRILRSGRPDPIRAKDRQRNSLPLWTRENRRYAARRSFAPYRCAVARVGEWRGPSPHARAGLGPAVGKSRECPPGRAPLWTQGTRTKLAPWTAKERDTR